MLYTIFISFAVEHSIASKGIHLYPLLDQPSILFSDHPLSENLGYPHSLWVRITKNFDWFFQSFWKRFPTSEFLDFGRLFTKWQKTGLVPTLGKTNLLQAFLLGKIRYKTVHWIQRSIVISGFPKILKLTKKLETWMKTDQHSATIISQTSFKKFQNNHK